jgi:hypothetical protein
VCIESAEEPFTRCSTFVECEAHVVGEDLSRQPADQVESVAGTGLFGAIELGQLPDRGLDPAPDAHQPVDGLLGPGIRHGAPERGLQVDGVGAALLVQDLADEALVPDHQAGDQSEPVPDNQPLIDIGRRQREGDDLIAQIGHEMAMEAEIILLLAGAITPSGLVLAREDLAARHPTVLADADGKPVGHVDIVSDRIQIALNHLLEHRQIGAVLGEHGSARQGREEMPPVRVDIAPDRRIAVMPLHLGEDLQRDDFGVGQGGREAPAPQPAVSNDASARVRHGEIDGDQPEFRGHGFFRSAGSMAWRSTGRLAPWFA